MLRVSLTPTVCAYCTSVLDVLPSMLTDARLPVHQKDGRERSRAELGAAEMGHSVLYLMMILYILYIGCAYMHVPAETVLRWSTTCSYCTTMVYHLLRVGASCACMHACTLRSIYTLHPLVFNVNYHPLCLVWGVLTLNYL